MAKPKAGAKMPARAQAGPKAGAGTKPVRLDLEPEVHRLLRLAAAGADMSMAAYARAVLERHLRGQAEPPKAKGRGAK